MTRELAELQSKMTLQFLELMEPLPYLVLLMMCFTGEESSEKNSDETGDSVLAEPERKKKANTSGPARGVRHRRKEPMDESQRGEL